MRALPSIAFNDFSGSAGDVIGFVGETMAVSVICQELSAVKKELYIPRNKQQSGNHSPTREARSAAKSLISSWTLARSKAAIYLSRISFCIIVHL